MCRDVATRERPRSRTICGPFYPMEAALGTPISLKGNLEASPTNDGALTTPPPSSQLSHPPRRRHHSCVTPNTKEFHTLATIFGWVTMSGPSSWSEDCRGRHKDTPEPDVYSSQYFDRHPILYEGDEDAYLDGIFQHSDMVDWSPLLDSR